MTELYLGVMDALWSITPGSPIFFVEGGGQGNFKGGAEGPATRTACFDCLCLALLLRRVHSSGSSPSALRMDTSALSRSLPSRRPRRAAPRHHHASRHQL